MFYNFIYKIIYMKYILSILVLIQYHLFAFILVPLNNGIRTSTKGYSATIYLGTPLKPFQVQIDTGSSKLAIRCTTCKNCTNDHKNPNFNPSSSSTIIRLTCEEGQDICSNCNEDSQTTEGCMMNQSFIDGGNIKGSFYKDFISFRLNNDFRGLNNFGCIDEQSNDFKEDKSLDGIWGVGKLSYTNINGQKFRIDRYVVQASASFNNQRVIGLCLSVSGGFMTIGGVNKVDNTNSAIVIPHDDAQNQYISNSVGRIMIGGNIITQNAGQIMPQLIIDSGSTYSQIHPTLLQPIIHYLKSICGYNDQLCYFYDQNERLCFGLNRAHLSIFPPLKLDFSGQQINWQSSEYLLLSQDYEGQYCLTITETTEHYILGDDFMINKYIIFEDSKITIYPERNCNNNIQSLSLSSQNSSNDYNQHHNKISVIIVIIASVLTFIGAILIIAYCLRQKFNKNMDNNRQTGQLQLDQPRISEVRLKFQENQSQS